MVLVRLWCVIIVLVMMLVFSRLSVVALLVRRVLVFLMSVF